MVGIGGISIPELGRSSEIGWMSFSGIGWFCALGLVGFQFLNWLGVCYVSLALFSEFPFIGLFHPTIWPLNRRPGD